MKAQFDKYFGTGKEYDEIDTNGNSNGNDNSNDNSNDNDNEKIVKKAPAKKSNEDQFDLFGFSG